MQTKFDAATLHSNRALAAETQMVDDGSGKVEVKFISFIQIFDILILDFSFGGWGRGGTGTSDTSSLYCINLKF